MKFSRLALSIGLGICLAAVAGNAEASRIYLSTTSTGAPLQGNPTITMTVGNTAALFLYWQPTTELVETGDEENPFEVRNDQLSGIGHDIISSSPVISRTAYAATPTSAARWGSVGTGGGAATFLVDDANFVKVGGSNMGQAGDTAGQNIATGSWRFATITFSATSAGTTSIKLGVGAGAITFQNSPFTRSINFGFGDAGVDSATPGGVSTLADATVIVTPIPEPSTLALLGLGAVGLVAVARRRRKVA